METKNIVFFLRMLKEFKNKDIPTDVFTESHKDYLLQKEYVELTDYGYKVTEKGEKLLEKEDIKEIKIIYPLRAKGRVKSYDKVIKSISQEAAHALLCAMVNNGFFNKIDKLHSRILMQNLIDNHNYLNWGENLIKKINKVTEDSITYFRKKKNV